MGHLLKFRTGWQNEYLADFILSKFCFIAKPTSIAEDIGSDFYCTFYEVIEAKYLTPKSAFAIQIKSNKLKINISKNINYYANLEIPFFVGVANSNKLTLEIYSGEAFTHFFTLYGNPLDKINPCYNAKNQVILKVVENLPNRKKLYDKVDKNYLIYLPKICSLDIETTYRRNFKEINEFREVGLHMQFNISAFKHGSNVYRYYNLNDVNIISGITSIKTFRKNFFERLAEAYSNLAIELKEPEYVQNAQIEAKKYLSIYEMFFEGNNKGPTYLYDAYINLKILLKVNFTAPNRVDGPASRG